MIKLIMDSNFLVATFDSKDNWHPIAHSIAKELNHPEIDLINFDLILSETISVLGRRMEEQRRSSEFVYILSEIRSKIPFDKISWLSLNTKEWYDEILNLIVQYEGKLNFNDAFLAICMQKNQVSYLISFDKDFDQVPWIERIYEASQVSALIKTV